MNPNQYNEAVKAIYDEALQAATDLLKEKGEKCFIAFSDWECETSAYYDNGDCSVSIFGIGINEAGKLCVAAVVDNIGYGHGPDDFPQAWTEATELKSDCFPNLYCFVAENIDKTISKVDMCMSCPPYFTLEKYSNDNSQCYNKLANYEDWLEEYWDDEE